MKRFAYIVVLFFMIQIVLSEVAFSEEKKTINTESINVGYFNNPPYVYIDKTDGKLKGAVYDFMQDYMAPQMGVKFNWDKSSSAIPRLLQALKDNIQKKYVVALLTYSPDRDAFVSFPKKPYFLSKTAIAIKKDNRLTKISSINDITNLTFSYAANANLSPFIKSNIDKLKFDFISSPDFHLLGCQKVLGGRVDAVYAPDKAALLFVIKNIKEGKQLKVLDLPEKAVGFYTLFSKGLEEEVKKYDQAMEKLDGQALFLKLLAKYLDINAL